MISKGSKFRRNSPGDPFVMDGGYARRNVIRTTFNDNNYEFTLSVIDTTKEGVLFPISLFMYNPKKFAFGYNILLNKGVIHDNDLKNFEQYKEGLDSAIQQDHIIIPDHQAPKKQIAEVEPVKTDFIDTWDVEIPKVGEKGGTTTQ